MRWTRFAAWALGALVVLAATPAWASVAATVPAPEIDGTSMSAGLGLLAAGVLIVRSRMNSK